MGDMGSRVMKLVLCETWPFSLDFWRSLRGIDVPDYERFVQIKKVMWALRAGPEPDNASYAGQVIREDVGPNRKLTIRCFSFYRLDSPLFEFPLTEYQVGPDVIRFKLDESDLKGGR